MSVLAASVRRSGLACVMLVHVQMPVEPATHAPQPVAGEQEYRNALWARFMANVDADDDAANDILVQAHVQRVRAAQSAA